MRNGALLAAALCLIVVVPRTASAQCAFSAGVACSRSNRPAIHVDFGLQGPEKPNQIRAAAAASASVAKESAPIDCKMVKPVKPKFTSAMVVAAPNPSVQLPVRLFQAPACKR
jgi:hypothetical protein